MEDNGDSATQPRSSAPRVRLSCEACRQRKVKCDKLSPCTSCQRLGFVCVPVERARLPRGRTRRTTERATNTDKELADRVAKLENLLKRVAAERDESHLSPIAPNASNPKATKVDIESWRVNNAEPTDPQPGPVVSKPNSVRSRPEKSYIASSFWEDIMQQTQELRTVLDNRLEHDQTEYKTSSGFGTSLVGSEGTESALSHSTDSSPQSHKGVYISPDIRRTLCEIYIRNVDPLFKVLHRPSLCAFLCEDKPYLDYEQGHQAPATLAVAVYYAAVGTVDDAQCHLIFGTDKKTISAELQKDTEAALIKSDFVTTEDLTVLQAYVISLLAARCQDQSRRVWTMMSMALRVGQALCLHLPEPPFHVNVFEQEMRRRCWQGIGLLDLAACLDRASEPMMKTAWLQSHPPSNIDDEAIWFDMEGPIQEQPEGKFTDMTHTLIIAAAQTVARTLAFSDFMESSIKTMTLRQQILLDFQQNVSNMLKGSSPDLIPFHLYSRRTANSISVWLHLGCLRPIQRSPNFTPPQVQGDSLLKLAADNLQRMSEVYNDPALVQWSWFNSMWVPWHALAVALAELCVCKNPATMNEYWPIMKREYHRSSLTIADSQHGMLWRPLEKLMNQVIARKRELLGNDISEFFNDVLDPVSMENPVIYTSMEQQNHIIPHAQHMPLDQHVTNYPIDMGMTVAAGQQTSPVLETTTEFEQWPNFWDTMDFDATPVAGEGAWANYENFIGDVYDSAESIFLPR
ncbi:hypothetical protein N7495_004222 [Penicillium taxi]|uniref:uncharacterized protein n=1 Tax=Penicillium taxi TaxID=168475 RepID=UPI002545A351|nr:uncharacterized protein N7495_004222 [Penicillium taxi]KAJ5899478.1 hypothetical protein N7495_004222 [Penicillium taxi]